MNDSNHERVELNKMLLGPGGRWDDGELAQVLMNGLTHAAIELAPCLLSLPWPNNDPTEPRPTTIRRELSRMIDAGDDPNLKALKVLTETRKPLSNRLTEVAELFGHTTSRTGRNHLKREILPWFLQHLIDRLQDTSDQLRQPDQSLGPRARPTRPLSPLIDDGKYLPELQAPIEPSELADVLKGRLIQVALDLGDLDEATRLAQIAATHGADLIEVGDPLIKRHGMKAAARIRRMVPGVPLVVEFSSSDWVDEQVELAAEAGADIVCVLGLDQPSRVERAVRAARNHHVGIVLAIPTHVDIVDWCAIVESAGADAISIIRNIDSAESAAATGARIREVTDIANVPLVISGGFNTHNLDEVLADDWSILIVGAAFVHAPDPAAVVQSLRRMIEPGS